MKLKLIKEDPIEKLTKRLEAIAAAIDLYNETDYDDEDNTVGLWLEYERNLALTESSLYTKGH